MLPELMPCVQAGKGNSNKENRPKVARAKGNEKRAKRTSKTLDTDQAIDLLVRRFLTHVHIAGCMDPW